MRIAVTGAGGQLGRELVAVLPLRGHSVVALTRALCDVVDAASVERAIDPGVDAVVNCAAWTAVDAAEDHIDEATAVNAVGAGNVAQLCARRGIAMLHVSTDFVFDGSAVSPIGEDATPGPVNAYGAGKLEGERLVGEALGDEHLVARTSWLFGQDGPNFVLTMLRLADERGALGVVADQLGSPTWTGHLAPALARLLERGARGTFHLTNSGVTSWYGFACEIVAAAEMSVPVEPLTTAKYPTRARRPRYSVLDNRRWRELGEPPLPAWEEGVRGYLASRSVANGVVEGVVR